MSEQRPSTPRSDHPDRRDFLKVTAAASVAAMMASSSVFAGADDTIRVGVIGCGGRGTGAAGNCLDSAPGVEIVAMGDLYRDRVDGSLRNLQSQYGDKVKVTADRTFTGFDAFEKVCALDDVNYVILATPPAFRPQHLAAAVKAGKNVFMEKPVAVDPVGIRSVIASAEQAANQGLGIVAGTQRRHQGGYLETMKRIHDGAIGDVVAAQVYWNQGGLWVKNRKPEYSDVEWQTRNWLYFTWLSGDHICEQHIHNLDVMNWAFNSTPVKAMGMGGRQVRTDAKYGNIFDHFAIEYEFSEGRRAISMCRQIDGTATRVTERIVGTLGTADPGVIRGKNPWRYRGKDAPYVQEHTDNIEAIRAGQPLNEGRRVAESTLTAIMGRMTAYTGKAITWEQAMNSELDLVPRDLAFGPLPIEPVATPGRTPLV